MYFGATVPGLGKTTIHKIAQVKRAYISTVVLQAYRPACST